MNKIQYIILLAVSFTALLATNPNAYAVTTYTISDQASCEAAPFFGTWQANPPPSSSICTITSDTTINSDEVVDVSGQTRLVNSATLENNGQLRTRSTSLFQNLGTLNNNGIITSCWNITFDGTVNNFGQIIAASSVQCPGQFAPGNQLVSNLGIINNNGDVKVNGGRFTNGHLINNYGLIEISIPTEFQNSGTTYNFVGGTLDNHAILKNTGTVLNVGGVTIDTQADTSQRRIEGPISGPFCDTGTMLQGDACIPVGSSLTCGPNTYDSDGQCLPVSSLAFCGEKTIRVGGTCLPDILAICADGTVADGDVLMCFAKTMSSMIGGTILDINTASLLIASIGVNPVVTGLVGVTLAGAAGQAIWFVHRKKSKKS